MTSNTFPDYDLSQPEPVTARDSTISTAEKTLLGFATFNLSALDHAEGLQEHHFLDDDLQAVYRRLLAERAAGSSETDPDLVGLTDVASPAELDKFERQAPSIKPGRIKALANKLIEGWQRRELRRSANVMGFEDAPVVDQIEAMRRRLDYIAGAVPGRAAGELPLGIVFANDLPDEYTPPDELIEGVLTVGAGSVIYGDSNSGKTFLVIDMACAIARGVPWMGRQVEQGLVVYVAAESPASVKGRLQAYQLHYGVKVPNFAIVQAPVNLFSGDADTELLIRAVKQVERLAGQSARLVIGDTLARLTAGGNENSGEDMGLVVQRFDRIRAETGAHFLLIHHSGKDAAKGARGHSSLRAAVDTEIEVQETPTGRCAEVMKQRDLGTKGERIGFTLEQVHVGVTKWGKPASTCVVKPTEAPVKEAKGKRLGPAEGAVLEFLRAHGVGMRQAQLVKHFKDNDLFPRASVYRAIDKLGEMGLVNIARESGMLAIADAAK